MKKIRITRVLALVMMLAVVLGSFAGCGGKSVKKTDEELIVGKWETNIDFETVMEEVMKGSSNAELLEEVDFSGITMRMTAEFTAEHTYTVTVDRASAETAIKEMVNRMIPAMKNMIRKELAEGMGVTAEEITDEQVDAMLPYLGVDSWDALRDMLLENMDVDAMFKDSDISGKYMLKDGKFYSANSGEVTEESESMRYELSGDTLVLHTEDTSDDMPEFMKTLTFKRVG